MDEIRALQRELAMVQEAKGSIRLSDRNLIDLLVKMQGLNKVELIFTTNAKTVLTPAHVIKEIHDELVAHMGRVSLQDIYTSVNVDMSYVEQYAKQVVEESASAADAHDRILLVDDELIAEWYLNSIMEDVNEILQEHGQISLGELAQQYGFAVGFMTNVVDKRLQTILKAQLKGNILYTEALVARQQAQIRGTLSAITRPTYLAEVVALTGLEERLVYDTVVELISTQQLCGTLRGREYVPTIFLDVQRESMYSFFQTNGYATHVLAAQLQITGRPSEFIKKRFQDCITLEDVVVSATLFLQLEGAIDGLKHDATWLDARSVLPSAIDDKNTSQLVSLAIQQTSTTVPGTSAVQLGGVFVVSSTFLSRCLDKFQEHAAESVSEAALSLMHAKAATAADPSKSAKKKAKSKTSKSSDGICPSKDEQSQLIMTWFDHCEDQDDFVANLVQSMAAKVQAVYDAALAKALASIHRGDSFSRREKFEDLFDELHCHLLVFQKGLVKLSILAKDQPDAVRSIEQSLLSSLAVEMSSLVLMFVNESLELNLDGFPKLFESTNANASNFTRLLTKHRTILEKKVPYAATLIKLWTLAQAQSTLSEFMTFIPTIADALSMPLRKFDRKKEKALVSAHKQQLMLQLESEDDLNHVLSITFALLFQTTTSLAIRLPQDASIQAAYPALRAAISLPPQAAEFVHELLDAAAEKPLQKRPELVVRAVTLVSLKDFTEFTV
ncbi:unnamed protein product [Aphanomyces euteiches]